MIHHFPLPAGAVGAAGAAVVGAGNMLAQTEPATNIFLQMGGVGLALGVGFWFIRRGDARDEKISAEHHLELEAHHLELEAERAAHEITRKALIETLKDNVRLKQVPQQQVPPVPNQPTNPGDSNP